VSNLLFRMGGAAVLLSSDSQLWEGRAKYQLKHNVRVHVGQSDDAYK
jgi:3-ketoacyl-CoA synthase